MFRRNFVFGIDSDTANVIGVCSDDLYQPGKGYGFVTEQNRREQDNLKMPELNSAFDTVYWYQDENMTNIQEDVTGCFLDSDKIITLLEEKNGEKIAGEHRRIPLTFKVDVPRQGNYLVSITILAEKDYEEILIFTGRRRLGFRGKLTAGKFVCKLPVNVCDIVPRGQTRIYTDKTLDITIVADKPRISELSVVEINCPTLYIGGDSTVTDQSADYPYAPGCSYSGWGQMLSAYVNSSIAVSNHAHSGLTTDSFRKEGHYAITERFCKPRDFYFFQFGHNDQKLAELKADEGYKNNLLRYIDECERKEMYPILVTPLARNTWKGNDGTYNDLLEEYARVCLEVGDETGVPVVDLHTLSMNFITGKGLEVSKAYFFPGDYTHSNDYGAYKMAGFVADEIIRVCGNHTNPGYRFLAKCITGGFGCWEPEKEIIPMKKPEVYKNVKNPEAVGILLDDITETDKLATRVDVLDMIIKTVRFFPTNVYNDKFTDVVGHEWYAGTIECACQNGMIDNHLIENNCFYPEREVALEEFIVFAMNGYKSRKAFPEVMPCAYDNKCADYAIPYVRAACQIGLLKEDGSQDLQKLLSRGEAVEYCRKMEI